ncbi:serine hydrolase [Clostridium sp.]|uniref:serine hydrolase n=1 Tax=Clostridium sp. TaxID=1506 RepID=UPI002612AC40|nr:serine hydrolase [uncultured Clostridium sp.]
MKKKNILMIAFTMIVIGYTIPSTIIQNYTKSVQPIVVQKILIAQNIKNVTILNVGNKDAKVLSLQKKLFNIGYTVSVNGVFSLDTQNVIKQFQKKYNLSQSGIYDTDTENILNKTKNIRDYDVIQKTKQRQASTIALLNRIKSYLGSGVTRVGFIYYDLSTGDKISINPNKVCIAASTYKVGMNMVAYDTVRAGKIKLTDGLKYNSAYYESGTGILQGQLKTTLKHPVALQKLLDYSIIYSDNIATNMISSRLGGARIVRQKVATMTGITGVNTIKNVLTPEIETRLLKKLYIGRNDKYYSRLISDMKRTKFHDRIDKYVPRNLVAHKIGNLGSYTNDVGIVFTDKPYLIVMYVDGLSHSAEKIATVSNMVYQNQLKR